MRPSASTKVGVPLKPTSCPSWYCAETGFTHVLGGISSPFLSLVKASRGSAAHHADTMRS